MSTTQISEVGAGALLVATAVGTISRATFCLLLANNEVCCFFIVPHAVSSQLTPPGIITAFIHYYFSVTAGKAIAPADDDKDSSITAMITVENPAPMDAGTPNTKYTKPRNIPAWDRFQMTQQLQVAEIRLARKSTPRKGARNGAIFKGSVTHNSFRVAGNGTK